MSDILLVIYRYTDRSLKVQLRCRLKVARRDETRPEPDGDGRLQQRRNTKCVEGGRNQKGKKNEKKYPARADVVISLCLKVFAPRATMLSQPANPLVQCAVKVQSRYLSTTYLSPVVSSGLHRHVRSHTSGIGMTLKGR